MSSQSAIVIDDSDSEYDVPAIEEVPKDDHYLDFKAVIVGIQYYKGDYLREVRMSYLFSDVTGSQPERAGKQGRSGQCHSPTYQSTRQVRGLSNFSERLHGTESSY